MTSLTLTDKHQVLKAASHYALQPLDEFEQKNDNLIAAALGQPKIREQLAFTIAEIRLLHDCICNIHLALLGEDHIEHNPSTSADIPEALSIGESATFLRAYTCKLLAKARAISACL